MEHVLNPRIIQGGMGVNISSWKLASAVSKTGELGTLSGTMLEVTFAHTLQSGDPDGHMRKALNAFPFQNIVQEVLDAYFVQGGIVSGEKFKQVPFYTIRPSKMLIKLIVCANFSYVWLAKQGHTNPVSINYLEKVSMPHIFALFGAVLGGVDVITMGAGIPKYIPEVINQIVGHRTISYPIPVLGEHIKSYTMSWNPETFFGSPLPQMTRPKFLPIISSNLLADLLLKLPSGSIDGFVIETPIAGGHNAPPRNKIEYGEKDKVDYAKIQATGIPFWIGGGCASPEYLTWAQSVGATGIQAGSIFALSEESGMHIDQKKSLRALAFQKELIIETSMRASPTGFPFKVARMAHTVSEEDIYENRTRICSMGGLRVLYERPDGTLGYRCAAEPIEDYISKGGTLEDALGRKCLCNGLATTAGVNLHNDEPAIVTFGDNYDFIEHLIDTPTGSYTAKEAVSYLLQT